MKFTWHKQNLLRKRRNIHQT